MGLATRLCDPGEGETKIPVHQFMAAVAEYKRGFGNLNQLANVFVLSTQEKEAAGRILERIDLDEVTANEVHEILLLGEGDRLNDPTKKFYDIPSVKSRLDIATQDP